MHHTAVNLAARYIEAQATGDYTRVAEGLKTDKTGLVPHIPISDPDFFNRQQELINEALFRASAGAAAAPNKSQKSEANLDDVKEEEGEANVRRADNSPITQQYRKKKPPRPIQPLPDELRAKLTRNRKEQDARLLAQRAQEGLPGAPGSSTDNAPVAAPKAV